MNVILICLNYIYFINLMLIISPARGKYKENQLNFHKAYYVVHMHVFCIIISCTIITCDNDENFDKGNDCGKDVGNDRTS